MTDIIFQSSDLANRRTEVLAAARQGQARLRDKDGASYVMLPEGRLQLLEELSVWSQALMKLVSLLRRDTLPKVSDLGDLAWLRTFDLQDLREFADELQESLVAAHADRDLSVLHECVHSWRITARQLEDPLRRSVLHGSHQPGDFVEVDEPDGDL